jgi:hypothetical protein
VDEHLVRVLDRFAERPEASSSRIMVVCVATSRSRGTTPIASTTGMAGPRTSTGFPLERCPGDRSTTVGRNPL